MENNIYKPTLSYEELESPTNEFVDGNYVNKYTKPIAFYDEDFSNDILTENILRTVNEKTGALGLSERDLAKWLIKKHNIICDNISTYFYNGSSYQLLDKPIGMEDIRINTLAKMIDHYLSHCKEIDPMLNTLRTQDDTIRWIKRLTSRRIHHNTDYICFKNGLYRVADKAFIKPTNKVISLGCVDANYDPTLTDITGSKFEAFLQSSLDMPSFDSNLSEEEYNKELDNYNKKVMCIQEMIGLCLSPIKRLEKFFILQGSGRNGKGVICSVLNRLVSPDIMGHLSLKGMTERFGKIGMKGITCNISMDDQTTSLSSTGVIKTVISSEPISVEAKGKDIEIIEPLFTLVCCFNDMPKITGELSNAFYDRIVLIPFKTTFGDESEVLAGTKDKLINRNLKEELFEEIDLIANWSLIGLDRVIKNKNTITMSRDMLEAKGEYKDSNNSVATWYDDEIVKPGGSRHSLKSLYNIYNSYCREMNLVPYDKPIFEKALDEKIKEMERNTGKTIRATEKNGEYNKVVYKLTTIHNEKDVLIEEKNIDKTIGREV